ncbi:hypothetical protein Golob_002524, partial [Gossypium lobatum]|nr:hypothetical protein [Gossypium lobatum]
MKSANIQGYEAWVVGKIMSREKVNREVMYRVLKYLWFTKEEVNFVALNEGVTLVKFELDEYAFNITPFWIRIYNIPIEQMDRQVAIDMGKAIGEVVAIDWRDRDGEKKINPSEGIKSDKDGDGEENDLTMLKGKEKSRVGEEEFESCFPTEKHPTKSTRDGGGKM